LIFLKKNWVILLFWCEKLFLKNKNYYSNIFLNKNYFKKQTQFENHLNIIFSNKIYF
jgi:hypothetical protein